MTRTELLTARGYPAEVINGNGHAPAESSTCSECEAPFVPVRKGAAVSLTCSPPCSARRAARVKAEGLKRRRANAQVAPTSVDSVPLAPTAEAAVQAALFGLVSALAAVMPPGGRLELAVDGEACLRWAP